MKKESFVTGISPSHILAVLAERPKLTRRIFQVGFLKLNLLIGIIFYQWVRYFESGGATRFKARPAGVEGWLPIASLMGMRYTIEEMRVPDIHPAGIFLMTAFLLISFLLHRAFCSWLCPVGTLSELLAKLGRKFFRAFVLPRWLDIPLRSVKYLLMGLFLYVVGSMSTFALKVFLTGDYGLIADVHMLNFFRFMSLSTAIALVIVIVLSVFIPMFWCRYLCPYGALLGLFGMASPTRIERSRELCTGCGNCSKACPSNLKVHSLVNIRSSECTMCLECVAACPTKGGVRATVGDPILDGIPRRSLSALTLAAAIAIVFLGTVTLAKSTGHWNTNIPDDVYRELVPASRTVPHPGR